MSNLEQLKRIVKYLLHEENHVALKHLIQKHIAETIAGELWKVGLIKKVVHTGNGIRALYACYKVVQCVPPQVY